MTDQIDSEWGEARGRIEERFERFNDRIERIEKTLEKIGDNSVWLIRLGIGALATLLGHAIMSYIQMGGVK